MEQPFRASINNWTRRSTVEQAETAATTAADEVARLRAKVARMEAETELRDKGELAFADDPVLQDMLREAEERAPEQAKIIREAIEARKRELIREAGEKAARQSQVQQSVDRFTNDFRSRIPDQYPHWQNDYGGVEGVLNATAQIAGQYGQHVRNRMAQGGPGANMDEFCKEWLDPHYAKHPKVQEEVKAWQESQRKQLLEQGEARGRKAAADAIKQERREAAQRHGARPPAPPAAAQSGGPATGEPQEPDPRAMTPDQRRKAMRTKAREIAGQFSGRR